MFAFNVSTLDGPSRTYLNKLGQRLAQRADQFDHLEIVGHASAKGTEPHNLTVSLRRAHNVAKALIKAGLPEAKVTVHGVGETQPLSQYDLDHPAQQCVLLQLVGAQDQGALQNLITPPTQAKGDLP
jgi:outer membrane protein OmpA-like peptidoglycan-associated protein